VKKKWLVGFYNVSVILTYLSLLSAVLGIALAIKGGVLGPICCLLFSGICDCFDGKVARAIERTDDEKAFGIQIDSLCDLIAFGVLPVVICFCEGLSGVVGIIILMLYQLAALVRLGYYNVTEQNRQRETDGLRGYFNGLPVTSIAVILPLVHLLKLAVSDGTFVIILGAVMFVVAVLFVVNIKVKKFKI